MFDKIYNYSAVLFTHHDIHSIESFTKILNGNKISKPDVINHENAENVSIVKYNYISRTAFSKSPDLETLRIEEGFNYEFYYFSFHIDGTYYSVIAVPWFKMGVELFRNIRPKSLSSNSSIQFYQIDLLKLIKSLKSNRDENMKLLSSNFIIESESNVTTLNISGLDPLYSELFTEIDELVDYKPNKCKLIHKQEDTTDLRVSFDNLGNFQFRVGIDISNLFKLQNIFSSLNTRELLKPIDGYYNPMKLRLRIKEDEDEQ